MNTTKITPSRFETDAGFTLVELLVVLAIIAMIAVFATPRVIGFLSSSKVDAAEIQIKSLSQVLDLYALQERAYPRQEDGLNALVTAPANAPRWRGPYLNDKDSLIDPWGQPYVYRSPGEHGPYDLYSLGADGKPGGEGEAQDITNW